MSGTQQESAKQFDGRHPEEQDYLRYFKSYSFLTHQRSMLEDRKRTGAYFEALMANSELLRDKVVLDVGTGSGILAIFAAKAGARRVYAVEATEMAVNARKLVASNGFQDVVTVIQGTMETVELPEKVDIIVSEWMGYLLLRESMLDSVIVARDRYLKPDGAMYPSHAQMFWAPIRTPDSKGNREEFHKISEHWQCFLGDMKHFYDVDFEVFSENYLAEQYENCLLRGEWADVHPDQLIGKSLESKIIDIRTITLTELKSGFRGEGNVEITAEANFDAICAWFDVTFEGSAQHPCKNIVRLSTAPDAEGATHWGQTVFYIKEEQVINPDDKLFLRFNVERRPDYERLLNVELSSQINKGLVSEKAQTVNYLVD